MINKTLTQTQQAMVRACEYARFLRSSATNSCHAQAPCLVNAYPSLGIQLGSEWIPREPSTQASLFVSPFRNVNRIDMKWKPQAIKAGPNLLQPSSTKPYKSTSRCSSPGTLKHGTTRIAGTHGDQQTWNMNTEQVAQQWLMTIHDLFSYPQGS